MSTSLKNVERPQRPVEDPAPWGDTHVPRQDHQLEISQVMQQVFQVVVKHRLNNWD
ncbi:MAG: hypothetical protein VX346_18095 [Planctomycetota bacterium]|nr:hypothetical protein [Planctomycetota bacterium]